MSAVDTRSGRWMAIVSLTPISLPPFRYIVCVHQCCVHPYPCILGHGVFYLLRYEVCVPYRWLVRSLAKFSDGSPLVGFRYLDPCRFCASLQVCLFGLLSEVFCCFWWSPFWVRGCHGRKWGHFPQMIESDSIFATCARKSSSQKTDPSVFWRWWRVCLCIHVLMIVLLWSV